MNSQNLTPGLYYSEMNSQALIDHCNEQLNNENHSFSKEQVAEMISLAGCPDDFPAPHEMLAGRDNIMHFKSKMTKLVTLAQARAQAN